MSSLFNKLKSLKFMNILVFKMYALMAKRISPLKLYCVQKLYSVFIKLLNLRN